MPAIGETELRHLLQRTEFVARSSRVAQLRNMTVGQAVDDILNSVGTGFTALELGGGERWEQGQHLQSEWLDQMAHGPSPMRERMALFWHGHLVSSLEKQERASAMRDQIDLYRRDGVNGSLRQMLRTMSLQPAMLRYLDNDRNVASSPNQNFARELMELFVLGVGNYTEADVEASTAAWTGHGLDWESDRYVFRSDRHERRPQSFLGRTINATSADHERAGFQTIDVLLGSSGSGGTVPVGPNAGRPTREVAAEFLTRKLWQEFGEASSGGVPSGVRTAMVRALLDSDFSIRPWLRAMLTHPDFYAPATRTGLVRQPVEYCVATLVASGGTAERYAALWVMDSTGQRLLYPPNVSGWRPNGYWISASAFEARNYMALAITWRLFEHFWEHPWEQRYLDYVSLPGGRIYNHEITGGAWLPAPHDIDPLPHDVLVDRALAYMDLRFSAHLRSKLIAYCESVCSGPNPRYHERRNIFLLILLAPEMHVA